MTGEAYTGFWWGDRKERDYLEDLRLTGSVILKWMVRKWDGDMNRIELAQGRDRWRALVKAVMNLWVP
jgi:hypothetical protein